MRRTPELPTQLSEVPVIAILRGCPFDHVIAVAGAAIEAGINVLEVTLDSERALDQISRLRDAYPTAHIGVGSVLQATQVGRAVDSGAQFVVTPVVDPETIAASLQTGTPIIAGAATPTEINRATLAGATAVKVFPIRELGGCDYLRAVMAPLGVPAMIPTGGVDIGNVGDFLELGVPAVGVGGSVFPRDALTTGDRDTVGRLARSLIGALR